MRSSRGRPSKVTKPTTAIQRRQSRQTLTHDPAALVAAAAAADHNDAIMGEVDAEADDDPSVIAVATGPASEAGAAAAIAAMSDVEMHRQLAGLDPTAVTGAGGLMPTAVAPQHFAHQHQPHHPHHQNPGASQYPMPPQPSQPHSLLGKTTEHVAHELGYSFVVDSAMAKRLAREPAMRMAMQRRSEQQLNLNRRSNVEALFAHIAGETAASPCKNCHKGHGPWTTCVVVDGQMCGSCANCWFNASGARCSFHETRNPQTHPAPLLTSDSSFGMPPMTPVPGGVGGAGFNIPPALFPTSDPLVKYHVEKAMADVRGADRKTRHLMAIEVTARQLALNIAQYEDVLREEQSGPTQAAVAGGGLVEDDGS